MKILVISLLRLGDILLATSVLRSLRRANPKSEIHILINGQFQSVAQMIPFVDKVYAFDRDGIQRIIGATDRNLLEAYFRIEDLVEQMQSEKYDQVVNLTHNRLSGWLTALIGCGDTRGVVFGSNGKLTAGSGWFDYLNDFIEPGSGNVFHFVDVFHYGAGLQNSDRRIELYETQNGIEFARQTLSNSMLQKRILIQPCTSETKKTLNPQKWREIGTTIAQSEPGVSVYVLGSPSEKNIIDQICSSTPLLPVICDLEQAYSLLNNCNLLVTCDTSIKHLATATKIKILEISIGSSEYKKTGAYIQGAVILQGLVPCAPCNHRGPCTQSSHLCSEKISSEMVAMVCGAMMRQDEGALRMLAHEYQEDIALLRTHINFSGDWAAVPLGQEFSAKAINSWVDRVSFKLYLQKEHEKSIGEYGSEGIELKKLLENIFPDRSSQDWVTELKSLERDVIWFESRVESFLSKLKGLLGEFHDVSRLQQYMEELEIFCLEARRSKLFESYGRQLFLSLQDTNQNSGAFQTVKKLRERLSHAHQRARIELKLIHGLQTGFTEAL